MSETHPPYNADEEPPNLETVITWVYHFPDGSRITIKVDAPPAEEEGVEQDQASQNYHLYLTDRLALIKTLNPRPMRHELMTAWLDTAQAAATPDELAHVLAEARTELTEAEYQALVVALNSAGNVEAEPGK
jgi:hypothetical protein